MRTNVALALPFCQCRFIGGSYYLLKSRVDRGAGLLTTNANPANVMFFTGTTINARMGDPAGMAVAIQGGANNQNNGSFLELRASTLGFNNVVVSWAWQRTATGFNSIQLQFSTDGTTFMNIFDPQDPPTSFSFQSVTFFQPSGAFNNPNFAFRWVLNGATSALGNVRFDNVVLEGVPAQPVPEPATMLLLATGLAGVAAKFRRRRCARDRK